MSRPRRDIAGQRFGRLTAIRYAHRDGNASYWHVRCDCGVEKSVQLSALTSGQTVSCGCLRIEKSRTNTKHGMTGTAEYRTWRSMLQRAHLGTADCAHNYLGRGITVCARWLGEHGFETFFDDMGPRPAGTSIDRINNDGNYEPGNCRWATTAQQGRNRRTNRLVTAFGKTQTVAEWAVESGLSGPLILWRLRAGRSPESAVGEKVRRHAALRASGRL